MFLSVNNLKPERIRDKLQSGMAPNQIALSFASNIIARELKCYRDGTLEDFVKELCASLILETHEESDIIVDFLNQEHQKGIDKLLVYLASKSRDDIQAFLEILQGKPSLASLATFFQAVILKCEAIPHEDSHNQSEIEVTLKLQQPGEFQKVEANEVIHVEARVTVVKKDGELAFTSEETKTESVETIDVPGRKTNPSKTDRDTQPSTPQQTASAEAGGKQSETNTKQADAPAYRCEAQAQGLQQMQMRHPVLRKHQEALEDHMFVDEDLLNALITCEVITLSEKFKILGEELPDRVKTVLHRLNTLGDDGPNKLLDALHSSYKDINRYLADLVQKELDNYNN